MIVDQLNLLFIIVFILLLLACILNSFMCGISVHMSHIIASPFHFVSFRMKTKEKTLEFCVFVSLNYGNSTDFITAVQICVVN